MTVISKKKLDKSMKLICEFHNKKQPNCSINYKYLVFHKVADEQECKHIVEVLKSMGYIKHGTHDEYIFLTDTGLCYFETKRETRNEKLLKIVPIAISVIALLKSFQNEIISIWRLIMRVLK